MRSWPPALCQARGFLAQKNKRAHVGEQNIPEDTPATRNFPQIARVCTSVGYHNLAFAITAIYCHLSPQDPRNYYSNHSEEAE